MVIILVIAGNRIVHAAGEGWFGQADPPSSGGSTPTIENQIVSGVYQMAASSGKQVDSIKAYIAVTGTTSGAINSVAAVYDSATGALVGTSDETAHNFGTTGTAIYKWTFSNKPTLTASRWYRLCVISATDASNTVNMYAATSGGSGGGVDTYTYSLPLPGTYTVDSNLPNRLVKITCYYSDAPPVNKAKQWFPLGEQL